MTLHGHSFLLATPRLGCWMLPYPEPTLQSPEPPSSGGIWLFPCVLPHQQRKFFQGKSKLQETLQCQESLQSQLSKQMGITALRQQPGRLLKHLHAVVAHVGLLQVPP